MPLFPRSLYGRFLLITVIPVVLVQIVATTIFYTRHWHSVSSHMASALAGEAAMIVHSLQHQPTDVKERITKIAHDYMYLSTTFHHGEVLADQDPEAHTAPKDLTYLMQELSSKIFLPILLHYTPDKKHIIITIQMADGILNITASRKRLHNPTTYIFIMWMVGASIIALIIAILFLRIQVRSIHRLAQAAEGFGRGEEAASFKPEGAAEVRRAGIAFVRMKKRIERQIKQRTEMLAGVSHDLRTPLTRIKLQLALFPEKTEETEEIQKDISEMQHMITGYLDFAKGHDIQEYNQQISFLPWVQKICDGYIDATIRLESTTPLPLITLKPLSYKRTLCNILDNAVSYADEVDVTLSQDDQYVIVTVDDNGPGIPEEHHMDVLKPFFRLDQSRNLETGGTGLGLSIARDNITKQGGKITLSTSPKGGLQVSIYLPL